MKESKFHNRYFHSTPFVRGLTVTTAITLIVILAGGTTTTSLITVLPTAMAQSDSSTECLGETATIVGTNGNDNIVGTEGNDVIALLEAMIKCKH